MTTTAHLPSAAPPRPDPMRRTARVAGTLYLFTFVSIPTLGLYAPVKDDVAAFLAGTGSTTGVMVGALSEVVVGLAGTATALVLFPVLRRQHLTAALGVVAARLLETALILVSVVSLLTVVTLRTHVAGTDVADPAALSATGHALVAAYTWTFLLSQSLMPVIVDALLGYLLYRSGLVPRILPLLAFVAAPLLLASDIAVYFGVYDNVSPFALLGAAPIAVFEFSLGVYLIVRGFRPSASMFTPPPVVGAPRGGDPVAAHR